MEMPVVYIDSYEYGYMQYDIDSNKNPKGKSYGEQRFYHTVRE